MKLSIVVPTIGRSQFIDQTIRSILKLKIAVGEVLLFCNGSFSITEFCQSAALNGSIKIIKSEIMLPVNESWNRAVECASGDYCLLIGDDDILLESALDEIDMLNNPFGMFVIKNGIINNSGKRIPMVDAKLAKQISGDDFRRFYLTGKLSLYMGGIVFNRKEFAQIGGFQPSPLSNGWGIDVVTWFLLADRIGKVNLGEKVGWLYRINSGQMGFDVGVETMENDVGDYVRLLLRHSDWKNDSNVEMLKKRFLVGRLQSNMRNRILNKVSVYNCVVASCWWLWKRYGVVAVMRLLLTMLKAYIQRFIANN